MIHPFLARNSYDTMEDSGLVIDERQVFVTRRVRVGFRGTLKQLFDKFTFGTNDEALEGQTRMFCGGPQGAQMVPGTASDPHWECDVEWLGLHSYVHGSAAIDHVFRASPLWAEREANLPKQYQTLFDSTFTLRAGTPYCPEDAQFFPDHPTNIFDHVPGYEVNGIMVTPISPHPSHPHIAAFLLTLPKPDSANMIDYSSNRFAAYNYSKNIPTTGNGGPQDGVWFPGSIQSTRILEPMGATESTQRIYQVQFTVRWLPRKSPL